MGSKLNLRNVVAAVTTTPNGNRHAAEPESQSRRKSFYRGRAPGVEAAGARRVSLTYSRICKSSAAQGGVGR